MAEEQTIHTLSNRSSLEPTWSIMDREGGTSNRNSGPSQSTRRHRIEEAEEEEEERNFRAAAAVNYDALSHRAPSERDQQRLRRQSLNPAKPGTSQPARPVGILQLPDTQPYQHSRRTSLVSLGVPPVRSSGPALKGRSSRRTSTVGHRQFPSQTTNRHQPESITVTDEGEVPTVLFGHQTESSGDKSKGKVRGRPKALYPPVSGSLQPGGHSHRRSITIQDTPMMKLAQLRRAVVGVSMYGATTGPSSESGQEEGKERSRSRDPPSDTAPRLETEGTKSVGGRSKGKSREQPSELDDGDELMSTTNKQYSQGPRRLRTQRSIMNSWVPTEWMHSEAGGDDAATSVVDNKSTTEWGRSVRSAAPSRRPVSSVYGYYGHGNEKSFAWSGGSRLAAVEQSPSEDELDFEKDEQAFEEEEVEPERDEPEVEDGEIGEIPDEPDVMNDDIPQPAPPPYYSTNSTSRENVLAAVADLEQKRHSYQPPKRSTSKKSPSVQSSATPPTKFPSVAARRAFFDGQIMGRPLPTLARRQAARKPEPEPELEPDLESVPDPEPESNPEPEPEPEPMRAPSSKPVPRSAPKIAPKPPPKPAPRLASKPAPGPAPTPPPV
ncbi:hypothetical protein FRB97_004529, partial [Tulasnella sp. 331]